MLLQVSAAVEASFTEYLDCTSTEGLKAVSAKYKVVRAAYAELNSLTKSALKNLETAVTSAFKAARAQNAQNATVAARASQSAATDAAAALTTAYVADGRQLLEHVPAIGVELQFLRGI